MVNNESLNHSINSILYSPYNFRGLHLELCYEKKYGCNNIGMLLNEERFDKLKFVYDDKIIFD